MFYLHGNEINETTEDVCHLQDAEAKLSSKSAEVGAISAQVEAKTEPWRNS